MEIVRGPPQGGIFDFYGSPFFGEKSREIAKEMNKMATAAPLYDTYNRAPLRFERGEGVWLITETGERYLDFAAGIAVNVLGHAHPHLVGALKDQADKVWHLSNLYEVPGQEKLAERLAAATFADKVFFTNSGAEALECAIKTARRYQYANGHPEKFHCLCGLTNLPAGPGRSTALHA